MKALCDNSGVNATLKVSTFLEVLRVRLESLSNSIERRIFSVAENFHLMLSQFVSNKLQKKWFFD
jgi:hypothetical protein